MAKQLLFSLTAKDFDFQYFTVSGHGGSGKDTSNTGARCIHRASGATGEGREERSQLKNRQSAFGKCVKSKKFQAWHKLETMRRLGLLKDIESRVDEQMKDKNLKIEYITGD
jgi:protein subunit release factor A